MGDFLRDQTSGELAGWLAYLRVDDEAQAQRTAIAMLKASAGGRQTKALDLDDDDEVIDTTAPGFADKFKGFTNAPQQRSAPRPMNNTQILRG